MSLDRDEYTRAANISRTFHAFRDADFIPRDIPTLLIVMALQDLTKAVKDSTASTQRCVDDLINHLRR